MFQYITDKSTLVDQANILFKSSISGGLSNIFAAWMIFVLLFDTPYMTNALLLGTVVTLLTLIRTVITETYLRKQKPGLNFSLGCYLFFTFSVGLAWAFFEFTQGSHDDEEIRNIVFLINFGLIAGSIAILSVWLPAFLFYAIPQAIAIFSVFINLDYERNYFIAFTFLIFMAVMLSTSYKINRTRKKEIELTHHNEELIYDLNSEIGMREKAQLETERGKQELEYKVKERTRELQNTNLHLERVIDKKEEAERNLQYLAYHDELTGLPNKNLLVDRVSQSIKISSRDNQQMAILFLDLDRFKTINDSLGHIIGDKLLKEVAMRLHETLRKHDTVSRNGGDEFVVVLEKLKSYNEAIYIAKKVINSLTSPFDIHAHKIHIGASIGISVFPTDGDTPLILLRNADTAMYRAKKAGGNQLQFYDPSMSNQLRDRLELENELHSALDNNEFYMVYQPQINVETGKTTGVESLLRWRNPKHGEIPAERFIPLLEETGLIYSVGIWVIKHVIGFVSTQPENDITFSINLSALQCSSQELVDFLESEIKVSGIDPGKIEFEITETLLINDFITTKSFLDKLHSLGCTIALDDFGTGYTSMTYLARLPIDVIKIDKTLVRNIGENYHLKSIVNAIVTMSNSLGVKNVFEGVETNSELEAIKSMNGEIIQGFLFSKPLDAVEISKWILRDRSDNVKFLDDYQNNIKTPPQNN
jgi:diguanylate cyclase (GGDEF)-like protein